MQGTSPMMFAQTIGSLATTAGNIYSNYQWAQANQRIYELQQQTQQHLMADAVETIYNSTQDVIREMTDKAKRAEFRMKVAAEAARGNAVAAQANSGVLGKRVSLKTNQQTFGAVDQQMGELHADLTAEIDATLDKQEYQTKKVVQNILAGPVDLRPQDYGTTEAIMDLANTGFQIAGMFTSDEQ